jgi:3-deoxy-7-phosphoheptulonate synthase
MANFPGIVTFDEVDSLRRELVRVYDGEAFIMQGGDCAEAFDAFSTQNLDNYMRLFLQMNAVLMSGIKRPIVKIGRIAGQFAKPRSSDTEVMDGKTLLSYRGDIINGIEPNENARKPDPKRLEQTYFYSAATLNYLRGLTKSGFASLKKVAEWNRQFAEETSSQNPLFDTIVSEIEGHLRLLETLRLDTENNPNLNEAVFYTSHEALILEYEEALVRKRKHSNKYYCLSGHMLWVGDRTRKLNEAHVEFLRGVENPIGIKVGTKVDIDELMRIIERLNPHNMPGKIVLISRMGADNVGTKLTEIMKSIKRENYKVIWQCDPMHGNTIKSDNNYKTRKFSDIMSEIEHFIEVTKGIGLKPGGIHLEMTGNNVTECLGGMQDIQEVNLSERYHTQCDPRLNSKQSLEIAFLLSNILKDIF